jgi:hypothetical protein
MDGLEIRKWGNGYGVWDTITETFVSSKVSRKHWLELKLQNLRESFRPIIVRWVFGIPTKDSIEAGIKP